VLYGAPTPRRRDALRNRSAIVRAASELMLSRAAVLSAAAAPGHDGAAVPGRDGAVPGRAAVLMPEIARRAGVGQATLYRHFRDRHTLVAAVVADQVARLESDARPFRDLLAAALRLYADLRRYADPRPIGAPGDGLDHRLAAALTPALRRAQQQGQARPGVAPDDLTLLFAMLSSAPADTDRAIALLLPGVCP